MTSEHFLSPILLPVLISNKQVSNRVLWILYWFRYPTGDSHRFSLSSPVGPTCDIRFNLIKCNRLLMVSSCFGFNLFTLNTCLIFLRRAPPFWSIFRNEIWKALSDWYHFVKVLRVNFARIKFDWFKWFMHILV